VDADPNKTARTSFFGKMKEIFDEGKFNAELGEDGFIRTLRDCSDEELFTKYGPKYNWDSLKTNALHKLVDEIDESFPTMRGQISRDWQSILESNCDLELWVRKLIEGRCSNSELHGIRIIERDDIEDRMSEIERTVFFLTYDPTGKRFNFRNFNRVMESMTECGASRTRYGRESKKSLTKFTEFDGKNITIGDPAVIMDCDKGNSNISGLMEKSKRVSNPRGKALAHVKTLLSISLKAESKWNLRIMKNRATKAG
jgi:hypothetical protein